MERHKPFKEKFGDALLSDPALLSYLGLATVSSLLIPEASNALPPGEIAHQIQQFTHEKRIEIWGALSGIFSFAYLYGKNQASLRNAGQLMRNRK